MCEINSKCEACRFYKDAKHREEIVKALRTHREAFKKNHPELNRQIESDKFKRHAVYFPVGGHA